MVNLRLFPVGDEVEVCITLKNCNDRASRKGRIELKWWEMGMEIVAIQMDMKRKLIHFMSRKLLKSLEKMRITRASASCVNLLGQDLLERFTEWKPTSDRTSRRWR